MGEASSPRSSSPSTLSFGFAPQLGEEASLRARDSAAARKLAFSLLFLFLHRNNSLLHHCNRYEDTLRHRSDDPCSAGGLAYGCDGRRLDIYTKWRLTLCCAQL